METNETLVLTIPREAMARNPIFQMPKEMEVAVKEHINLLFKYSTHRRATWTVAQAVYRRCHEANQKGL